MKKQQEIEQKLQKLIKDYNLEGKLTVEMIKNWIWQENGETAMEASNKFQKKVFNYFNNFNNLKSIDKLNEVLQIFNDAWNYFPHKSLGGKSPSQKVKEELKKHPELKRKPQKKPDFIVGGRKLSWNEYRTMIRKMEELQKPFKKWAKEEVLPKYRNYLVNEKKLPLEIVEKNCRVADVFFERAMWVGFITFEQIRPEFTKYEFPRWWQTHVLGDNLYENEVWLSLKILLRFLAEKYNLDVEKFFK